MSKHWTIENTIIHTWCERDRASIRLESDLGGDIISLWDEEVTDFIVDGFKRNEENWHTSLVQYANECDLVAK